jgi:hypothetical protein
MMAMLALEKNFLHIDAKTSQERDPRIVDQWRRRYEAALHRLQQARVPTARDPRAGFEIYRSLRGGTQQGDCEVESSADCRACVKCGIRCAAPMLHSCA